MSRPSLSLPIRALSRSAPKPTNHPSQWVCRRCLTTATPTSTAAADSSSSIPTLPKNVLPNRARTSTILSVDSKLRTSSATTPEDESAELDPESRFLKISLPHKIPQSYLAHTTSTLLPPEELAQRSKARGQPQTIGVVVSSGLMEKTVRVRVNGQTWNKRIKKYMPSHTTHLVHDHNSSLLTGDVIELQPLRVSKTTRHVVKRIISPYGTPISERAPIPTPEQWLAAYKEKRSQKIQRRTLRRQAACGDAKAIAELQAMELDPGRGVSPGEVNSATPTGAKGQKLPAGVLPGGKHEVGKIGLRAKRNKEVALNLEQKTGENLVQAQEQERLLKAKNLGADTLL